MPKAKSEVEFVEDSAQHDGSDEELPPEFDGVTSSANSYAPTSSNVSLGELNIRDQDNSHDEEIERAKLDPPAGDWEKDDRWESRVFIVEQDSLPNDLFAGGRIVINIWGKPKARVKMGLEYQPTLRVRLSPDKRHRQDEPEKIDSSYKMYLLAKDLYLALNGRKLETVGDKKAQLQALEEMLTEENYVINTTVFNNSLFSQGLKVKLRR